MVRWLDRGNWLGLYVRSSDGKAQLKTKQNDDALSTVATSASALTLTPGNWYTAKVVVDDDPGDASLQRLRFWVDTDDDGDYSDETTLITSTAVDDDWSAGYVGLYKGGSETTVHQWDDFQVGLDNNDDGDIADDGDDILVSDDLNSNQVSLSYDNNGNLTNDGVYKFEYDAWNRLRKAILTDGSDETTIAEYEYYANNRRAKKTVSNRGVEVVENDGGNTTVLFYYDKQWRILETRNGSNQTTFQHLWGTRYTDELIWLEKNGDPTESNDTDPDDQSGESTADERYFVHQDRNWNVVALSEYDTGGSNHGRIVERYSYTPYGSFVVLKGDSGGGELNNVSLTSTVGNPFAHQGLCFDSESDEYQNRMRHYSVRTQRFDQRDALGYLDSSSMYSYVTSNPTSSSDPSGLATLAMNILRPATPGCDTPCGLNNWIVEWDVDNDGTTGWIIQHVAVHWIVYRCSGDVLETMTDDWWEAWEYLNGTVYNGPALGGGGALPGIDVWGSHDRGECTTGLVVAEGHAAAIENYVLESPPWGSHPLAGTLPAMGHPGPEGWNDSSATIHRSWQIIWDCCGEPDEFGCLANTNP